MATVADEKRVGRKARQPDPTSQELHDKLGRLIERKRKNRTNAEIAEAAGVGVNHFNMLLRGDKKNPTFATIAAILAVLPATWTDFDRS